jgi:hypothetical protein
MRSFIIDGITILAHNNWDGRKTVISIALHFPAPGSVLPTDPQVGIGYVKKGRSGTVTAQRTTPAGVVLDESKYGSIVDGLEFVLAGPNADGHQACPRAITAELERREILDMTGRGTDEDCWESHPAHRKTTYSDPLEAIAAWTYKNRLSALDHDVINAWLTELANNPAPMSGDLVWYLRGKNGDQVVGYDRGLNLNVAWLTVGYVRALAPFAGSSRCPEAKPRRWPKFERDLDNRGHSGRRSKPVQSPMPCQECFNVGDHCECGDLLSNKSMT